MLWLTQAKHFLLPNSLLGGVFDGVVGPWTWGESEVQVVVTNFSSSK